MNAALEKVQSLAQAEGSESFDRFLASDLLGHSPFEVERIASLVRLSQAILQDEVLRQDPACVALGYWLRKANLEQIRASHDAQRKLEPELVYVPSGKVFHVAPANVDTLFMYSWALAYLCGNANVVRLSTRPSPIVQGLLGVLTTQMKKDAALATYNRFVTYEHDEKISQALSLWCTHRVVWGGDDTVAALRAIPLNPHASERSFASKFSYAVISADSWSAASEGDKAKLAAAFFNDAFWFGQMACSSPHAIFWVGDKKRASAAVASFEAALEAELKKREHASEASVSMKRLAFSFQIAAEADVRVHLHEGRFVTVDQKNFGEMGKEICGGGVFRHACVEQIEEIASFAGPSDQTVTHFGFSETALRALATQLGARGVDRVVPIGEALAFDPNWDGFSLIQDFLRRVTVRS